MLRLQGSLWTPWKCIKVLHVSVHVHFFKWRPFYIMFSKRQVTKKMLRIIGWSSNLSLFTRLNTHMVSSPTYFHCRLIQSESCPQNDALPEATEVSCWTIRMLWLSLKKLPVGNVITFLSCGAEPPYDSKHIFFKKRWAYLCPDFAHTHYRFGKSFSQGKNTSLSFPIASLFWQQRPTMRNIYPTGSCWRFSLRSVWD